MASLAGLTLRELRWRADGRRRHDWQIAADLMATQINLARHSENDPIVLAADLMPPDLQRGEHGPRTNREPMTGERLRRRAKTERRRK